jgi:hypothetical protein
MSRTNFIGGISAENRPLRPCQQDQPVLGLCGKHASAVSGDLGGSPWTVKDYINDICLCFKYGVEWQPVVPALSAIPREQGVRAAGEGEGSAVAEAYIVKLEMLTSMHI